MLPFAETHALCAMVDGVLVVAREEASSLQDIRDSLESLAGAFLLGVVYNGSTAPNQASRYGYYGYAYTRRRDTK